MKTYVVIPSYEERQNIEALIRAILAMAPDFHILVVDDNSPDGTADLVQQLQHEFSCLHLLKRAGKLGFGTAYLDGFNEILKDPSVEAVLMMDADLSHHPKYIPRMVELLREADVVIGSRYVAGGAVQGWGLKRRLLSSFGNRYVRAVTGLPIRDCTAGYILLRAPVVARIAKSSMQMAGYAFLMELKHKVWKWGLRIRETPIVFCDRTAGQSKISDSIVREGIQAPWRLRRRTAGA